MYKVYLDSDLSSSDSSPLSSRNILIKRKFLFVLFRIVNLLIIAIPLPALVGGVLAYVTKIQDDIDKRQKELQKKQRELQAGFVKRKLELEKQIQKIEVLVKKGQYQFAWDLYQDARSNYFNLLSIGSSEDVNKLNPQDHIGSGPFGEFVNIWHSDGAINDTLKGIGSLKSLRWADYNLDAISHKMIFDKLLDNPEWLKVFIEEINIDSDLIAWIKENFSQEEWSKIELSLTALNVSEKYINVIRNMLAEPQLNLDYLNLQNKGECVLESLNNIRDNRNSLIIIHENRKINAIGLLERVLRDTIKPFPCYTEQLPLSESDYDFLTWLFSVVGQGILEFLCFNPYYWNESNAQTKMGIASVVNAVYIRDNLNTLFVNDRSKPVLKSLLSYMEKAPFITPDDASKLEFHLSIVSRISIASHKGIFLIVNPLLLNESKLNALAMRVQMLARYKVFLRLFVDKRSSIEVLNRECFDDTIEL